MDQQPRSTGSNAGGPGGIKSSQADSASPEEKPPPPSHRGAVVNHHQVQQARQHGQRPHNSNNGSSSSSSIITTTTTTNNTPHGFLTAQPIPHVTMTIDAIVTDPALRSFLQTSQHAREQALGLADRLAAISTPDGTQQQQQQQQQLTADQRIELSKEQKLLNTNLSHLRGLHRAAFLSARDTKAQTAEARQEVDVLHLQLQNLYYEQRHLQGEIAACESFDHEYQKLPLVPVDEFLAKRPEHAGSDENTLMIARIEDERAEREALEQQRQELLRRKQKLIAENKKRREDLANLDNDLEKFIDAAKPIQKTFEKVI